MKPESEQNSPFAHYPLKHRIIAWVSSNLFDSAVYTVRHGLLRGMRRKGGLGWAPEKLSRNSVTAEQNFWERLDLSGKTVYDVGAFHGLLTLFFASRAKAVVCFEPNKRNRERLMENLALNGIENVVVRATGVGSRRETLKMVGDPLMPGGSSVDGKMVEHLERTGVGVVTEEIPIIALDEEIRDANLPAPEFIKIDIEGWELEALRGARETLKLHKPALFLEMHGQTMQEKERKVGEIVSFLWELEYKRIRHIETDAWITPENASVARQGHLYCI